MFGLFKSKNDDAAKTLGADLGTRIGSGTPDSDQRTVAAADAAARVEERHVLPVVSEQLDITKRRVEGDTVRVDISTQTELQTATVELMRDAVSVERVAIDQPVQSLPTTRTDGATTIIPVVRERLVVKKELVLVEEIHITHRRDHQTVSRDVELRRQVPEVTRTPAAPSSTTP